MHIIYKKSLLFSIVQNVLPFWNIANDVNAIFCPEVKCV